MWPVFPPSSTLAVIGAMFALVLFAIRIVQPEWWASRPVRVGVLVAFGGMLVGMSVWGLGRALGSVGTVRLGAGMAYVGIIVLLPAAIVMPVSAAIDRALIFVTKPKKSVPTAMPAAALTRRSLIRFGAATLPVMASAVAGSGLTEGARGPTTPIVRLRYPGLHPDLHGLRILHLSDLHLGAYLGLEDLARALTMAREVHKPDLIVLTGDLVEDSSLIPGALGLVAEMDARYGAFASLGNHEYIHHIQVTRPLYDASPVPLLVGTGRSIRIGRATLFVGGADDPVTMHGDIPELLRTTIVSAASTTPDTADFRLLLCHRPEGHGPATDAGFDLTLSGHTHGGQLGLLGRSLFEWLRPGIGWWGSYAKKRPEAIARSRAEGRQRGPGGPSRLYTTSGFGHWFPFRVGCPTEMPLIVLEREDERPAVV